MDTNVRISRSHYGQGRYIVFAYTNWKDDISSHPQKLTFEFWVRGKSGAWGIECKALAFTATARTLKEAQAECESAVHELYNHKLDQIEVWRNSGGFLCVAGWCGKNWYVYASKASYDNRWTVTSESGGIHIRETGENLGGLVDSVIAQILDWELKLQRATKTETTPTIPMLQAAFQQAEAKAQYVAGKGDFTPDGEREFREATRTMKNAYNALWHAEQKQWGNAQ